MIDNLYNKMQMSLLGPYAFATDILKERNEVMALYNFYYGKSTVDNTFMNDFNKGQSWHQNISLDYKPTQDIRNHTKRLIRKQARFMFGVTPTILFKGLDRDKKTNIEELRKFVDTVLEDNEFWNDTFKAFIDCTIGKRVLLRIEANPKEPITIHYHTMDEFTFEVDKSNYKKLTQVIIAYMDKSTVDKVEKEQIWYRWKYYIENGTCMLVQGTYNGFCEPIDETIINTELDEIPCRVIINGGLTADIEGSSDIIELMDLQNSYNKTVSDFRDALRFKMFEQPVFIDADSESTENIKIAPNAIIDLKTDPTMENSRADAKMLSSSFSFVEGTKAFLELAKEDLYELMDMPKSSELKNVPSAKALRFTFFDLISRCEEKWLEWDSALKWLINNIIKYSIQFKLYNDEWDNSWNDLKFRIVFKHNYPIPEDESESKDIAIKEVAANVRSIKSYIRDLSDEEEVDIEYEQILKELEEFNGVGKDDFETTVNDEIDDINSNKADDDNSANNIDDNSNSSIDSNSKKDVTTKLNNTR